LASRCGRYGTKLSNIQRRVSAFPAVRAKTRSWRNPPFCCFDGLIGNRHDNEVDEYILLTWRSAFHRSKSKPSEIKSCIRHRQTYGTDALYKLYVMFGEDPFVPVDPKDAPVDFSGWNYASSGARRSPEVSLPWASMVGRLGSFVGTLFVWFR